LEKTFSHGTLFGQQIHNGIEVQPSTHGKPPIKSQDQPYKKNHKTPLEKKIQPWKSHCHLLFNKTLNWNVRYYAFFQMLMLIVVTLYENLVKRFKLPTMKHKSLKSRIIFTKWA
jgi:hypothetical protein